jgi:histidinol phosphatase-like enzyme
MLLDAIAELNLDASRSVLVGDKISDLEAAANGGMKSILVRTGHGRQEEERLAAQGRRDTLIGVYESLHHAHAALLAHFAFCPTEKL